VRGTKDGYVLVTYTRTHAEQEVLQEATKSLKLLIEEKETDNGTFTEVLAYSSAGTCECSGSRYYSSTLYWYFGNYISY
jgi:hypothetical protein